MGEVGNRIDLSSYCRISLHLYRTNESQTQAAALSRLRGPVLRAIFRVGLAVPAGLTSFIPRS